VGLGLLLPLRAAALDDDVRVPIPLQATLLAKVARYDGKLAPRAGTTVRVLVVYHSDDERSRANAGRLKTALDGVTVLQGRAQQIETSALTTATALAEQIDREHIAIVVLSTGFAPPEVRAVTAALAGHDVLSASLDPGHVPGGAVLGFDVAEGKPTILVNLGQARRQNVQLAASLLALVKVVP
jgi:hypothetical protein